MPHHLNVFLRHYRLTGLVMILTFDLWPWKPFQQCPLVWWILAARNRSTKCKDIASHKAGVNRQQMDVWRMTGECKRGQTTREHDASIAYCCRRHNKTWQSQDKLWLKANS